MRSVPLSLLATLLVAAGCGPLTEPRDEFVPMLNSLHVPESIATSDPLPVFLRLQFGSSSCTRFVRIEVERIAALVRIQPVGRRTGGRVCTMDVWAMDTTLVVPGPHAPSIEGRMDLVVVQDGVDAFRSITLLDPDADS